MGEKKNGACGIPLLVWIISSVILTVIFNSINETGQSMGDIVFSACLIGALFGFITFAFRMAILTSKHRNMPKQPFVNPYVDTTLFDTGNDFPTVNYPNLFLKPGERMIYAVPAQTFTEKEQVVGYSGSSAGVSVRVAKGMSVRSGGSKGTPIRQSVKKFNSGDYIVTNMRVVFISQNDGFEYDIRKISAIKPISRDAFVIMCGNKQKNMCVNESQIAYALGMTNFAVEQGQKTFKS